MSQERQVEAIAVQATPVITNLNPASGPTAGGNPVLIDGSGLSGATSVRFGAVSALFSINSDSRITAIAPPGNGTVPVTVTSASGVSNSLPYTYGSPPPTLTSLTPTSGPASGGNVVILTGTNFNNATAVRFGANLAAYTVLSNTQISATAPAGTGTVQVNVTTPGGTSNSLPYSYVLAPTITSIAPIRGPLPGGTTVTLTGANFTGATAVTFGSTPAASFTVVDGSHITATSPGGNPPGPVQVTVTTFAGTSNAVSYFYIAAPTVTAVTPNQGPEAGGNTVSVLGTNFTTASAVLFGAVPAPSFTVVTDGQIDAVAPAGSATVSITVVTAGGVSAATAATTYTYLPSPSITALTPAGGPQAGGNPVIITGAALTFVEEVRFGSSPAAFAVLSDTQVVAIAPLGLAGMTTVTVTTPGGTSPGATYTYFAPPGS